MPALGGKKRVVSSGLAHGFGRGLEKGVVAELGGKGVGNGLGKFEESTVEGSRGLDRGGMAVERVVRRWLERGMAWHGMG